MIIRELLAAFGVKTDEASLDAAKDGIEGIKSAVQAVGTGMAFRKVYDVYDGIIERTIAVTNRLEDMTRQTGLSRREFENLEAQAADLNITSEELRVSMVYFSRALGRAGREGQNYAKMFRDLKVETHDGNKELRNTYDVLLDVADAMKNMPHHAERAEKALALFNRSGARMASMLSEGSIVFYQIEQHLDLIGSRVSDNLHNMALQGQRLGQLMRSLTYSFQIAAATELFPKYLEFRTELIQILYHLRMWITDTNTAAFAMMLLRRTVQALALAFGVVLLGSLGAVNGILGAITFKAFLLKAKLVGLGAVILGLAALIYLIFGDIHGYLRGDDSVIGQFQKLYDLLFRADFKPEDSWLMKLVKMVGHSIDRIWRTSQLMMEGLYHGARYLARLSFTTRSTDIQKDALSSWFTRAKEHTRDFMDIGDTWDKLRDVAGFTNMISSPPEMHGPEMQPEIVNNVDTTVNVTVEEGASMDDEAIDKMANSIEDVLEQRLNRILNTTYDAVAP